MTQIFAADGDRCGWPQVILFNLDGTLIVSAGASGAPVETTLMPGADTIVRAYHRAGVKIGVVTNRPEAFSREMIMHFGLSDAVDVIVGGDTCATQKPDPEMLIYAVRAVGFSQTRAIMVGDSAADVDAAKAAYMASVVVRGGSTRVPVDHLGAHIVIDRLDELPRAIEALKSPA